MSIKHLKVSFKVVDARIEACFLSGFQPLVSSFDTSFDNAKPAL